MMPGAGMSVLEGVRRLEAVESSPRMKGDSLAERNLGSDSIAISVIFPRYLVGLVFLQERQISS